MTVLGTYVPVSWWSLLVLVPGVAVGAVVHRRLAARAGWRRRPTLVALLALATTLALTLTPQTGRIGVSGAIGVDGCLPDYAAQLVVDPFANIGGIAGGIFNLLLFLPLGLTAVLATRRWPPPAALLLLLPPAVEVFQSWIPGRYCNSSDIVTNIVGGLAGVLVGATWVHLRAPRRVRSDIAEEVDPIMSPGECALDRGGLGGHAAGTTSRRLVSNTILGRKRQLRKVKFPGQRTAR